MDTDRDLNSHRVLIDNHVDTARSNTPIDNEEIEMNPIDPMQTHDDR